MPDVSFKYNGALVTIREAIGKDEVDSYNTFLNLANYICIQDGINPNPDKDKGDPPVPYYVLYRAQWVAEMILRSKVEGDLGFPFPTNISDYEAVQAFHDNLMNAPAKLTNLWRRAERDSDLETPDPKE